MIGSAISICIAISHEGRVSLDSKEVNLMIQMLTKRGASYSSGENSWRKLDSHIREQRYRTEAYPCSLSSSLLLTGWRVAAKHRAYHVTAIGRPLHNATPVDIDFADPAAAVLPSPLILEVSPVDPFYDIFKATARSQ